MHKTLFSASLTASQTLSQTLSLAAALAGIISAGFAGSAQAASKDAAAKEKCYGIAKAGKNDCAAADGSHACMGLAAKDNSPVEWVHVEAGTCAASGGSLQAPKQ